MKHLTITILTILVLGGCATVYSPEQLLARAQDKSDFDLCFDMVLPNPSEYSKQELMNRRVDCNLPSIKDEVISKREKQIALGQALIAFGNSVQSSTSYPTYNLPNYSQPNTSLNATSLTQNWSLQNSYIQGTTKVCVYSLLGKVKYETYQNKFINCPMSKRYPME